MRGLVIVGHGSRIGNFRDVLELHKRRIEMLGYFDEVKIAFVMEEPKVEEVIEEMRSDEIYVVPVFISEGEHVIDIRKRVKSFGDRVKMCDPIGREVFVTMAIVNSAIKLI